MRGAAPIKPEHAGLVNFSIGLAGEAGEALDLIKKHVFHDHELDRAKLKKEIGDVVWYAAALAAEAGLTFEDVLETNVQKLRDRYPDGFSPDASQRRAD